MAINTINATIQMRKGLEQDFDADEMTAGEFAVSTDTRYVRMCFRPGFVLRMATYESFEEDMREVQAILAECRDIQVAVDAMADLAERHKNDAAISAESAKTYSNTSKDYRNQAEQFATSAEYALEQVNEKLDLPQFDVDGNGNLIYTFTSTYRFFVDDNGNLNWEVAA